MNKLSMSEYLENEKNPKGSVHWVFVDQNRSDFYRQ